MLRPKHQRFVAEFLKDHNATQAAIRAGYASKNADVTGPRLLRNVRIAHAVAKGLTRQGQRAELTAGRLLEEYRRLAFTDVRSFYDEHGNLKPMHHLTAEQGSQLAGAEIIKKNLTTGDGKTDEVHKIKLWDKTKAMNDLARHFSLLHDKLEVGVTDEVLALLDEGRARLAAERKAKK